MKRLTTLGLAGWLWLAALATAQQLDPSYSASTEVQQLSQWIGELQQGLQSFGFNEVRIGGSSARAILDHLYQGKLLKMRDLDIFAVARKKIDAAFAENIGRTLESATLGKFSQEDLRPRPRSDPNLPYDQRMNHNAGFGFFWKKGGDILDLSIFHTSADLELNGLFDFDKIMIRLKAGESLTEFIRDHMRGKFYEELVREGSVVDDHSGYSNWQQKKGKIINWSDVERDPALQALRVIGTYRKLGYETLPADVASRMRGLVQGQTTPINRLQMVRSLMKILEGGNAAITLKMAGEAGAFQSWSLALDKVIVRCGASKLDGLLGSGHPSRSASQKLEALIEVIPPSERLALLGDLYAVPQAVDRVFTCNLLRASLNAVLAKHGGIQGLDLDALLSFRTVRINFATEIHRIVNSRALSPRLREDLLIRAVLRRTPVRHRRATLAKLCPALGPARTAQILVLTSRPRIGYFTGVLNPPHFGHHDGIAAAVEQKVLDRIIVIPTPTTQHNETPISWEHRLAMVGRGLGDIREAEIISPEFKEVFQEGGTRRVLEVLDRTFRLKGQNTQWVHVMGADSFERFMEKGYLSEAVQQGKELLVLSRPGIKTPAIPEPYRANVRFHKLDIPVYSEANRSSTLIRKLLAEGKPISSLVPQPVAEYIKDHGLYREAAASGRMAASPRRDSAWSRVRETFAAQSRWADLFRGAQHAPVSTDVKLASILTFISEVPTASGRAQAIVKAIRSMDVHVYWIKDWKTFDPYRGGSGALSKEDFLFLDPKHSFETLVMEIVHEGTHAEAYGRTAKPASEREAFLAELEFAEAAQKVKGVKLPRTLGKITYEQAKKMLPAQFEELLQTLWPQLYGSAKTQGHQGMWMKVKESVAKTGRGAMGMGFFAGGFLLKETVQGVAQKDYGKIKKAVKEMGTPGFLGGFAVFAGAQHAVEKGVKVVGMKGAMASVTRFALPLYAAVGIMHAVSGKSTPLDAASDATSFAATALAMMPADMALRAALYPALIAAGPAGWAGIAAMEITKAALLLWGSEKIRPYVKKGLEWTLRKVSQAKDRVVNLGRSLANVFAGTTRKFSPFGYGSW